MTLPIKVECERPSVRPQDPRFSSGPCKKHPGWDITKFPLTTLGRSHRAREPKARLTEAIDRSADILGLPDDWVVAIVPASDTGAFEMALWSMLGERAVDIFAWESFSSDWLNDIQNELGLSNITTYQADYGKLPDLTLANPDNDQIFVFNGTTSGVRVPNLDWVSSGRSGLVFCDATSAAFAMDIDYSKLDVLTWSWQKVLGSEGGFGMLALSPRAVARLESYKPQRPLPKIFRLTKNGKLIKGIFKGATINTPSLLALEDLHSALDWADSIGGLPALIERSQNNFNTINRWVNETSWISWLAEDPATLSTTSMCLKIVAAEFVALDEADQAKTIKYICALLAEEGVAYDIASYRDAPSGFRIWGGGTVEASDLEALLPWLDWGFRCWINQIQEKV